MPQNHIPTSSAHATGINSDAGLDQGFPRPQQSSHRHLGSNLLQATLGRIANFHIGRYANAFSAAVERNGGRPGAHPTDLFGPPAIDYGQFLAGVMDYARGSISGREEQLQDALRKMQSSRLPFDEPTQSRPAQRPDFSDRGDRDGSEEGSHLSESRSRSGGARAQFHAEDGSDLGRWRQGVGDDAPDEAPVESREAAPTPRPHHRPQQARQGLAPGEPGWQQPEPTAEEREAMLHIFNNLRQQGIRNAAQLVGVTAGSGQHHPRTRNNLLPLPREVQHHHHTTHSHDGSGDGDGGDEGPYEDELGNT